MATGQNNYARNGETCLMFIEPSLPPTAPIQDELSRRTQALASRLTLSEGGYRGTHLCSCGARSGNKDHYFTPAGHSKPTHVTNSLMAHYVECHRDEIPRDEIEELNAVLTMANL